MPEYSALHIPINCIDLHQIDNATCVHYKDWHWAWEVWAYEAGIQYPGHEVGVVPHFNIIDHFTGVQHHVYVNAYNIYEAVPRGARPSGY